MSGQEESSTHAMDMMNDKMEMMQQAIANMGNTFKNYMEYLTYYEIQSSEGQNIEELKTGSERLPLLRQFQNLHPPSFRGATNPATAEAWIQKLEKMFKILKCIDAQKVELSAYMLEGEADDRWNGAQEGILRREERITWELFVRLFYHRYFSTAVRERKE